MSQAPRGKNDWFKDHYEKILLFVALVALLFSSVHLIQHIQNAKESVAVSLARIYRGGNVQAVRDTAPFEAAMGEARTAATAPMKISPRTMISELRVSCVKCGRPIGYKAEVCPFCLAEQPEPDDSTKRDTDGDGIPDHWELAMGLDPQDPADAHLDLDGDGFTNLEEFLAGTDPRDPNDSPDPIVKLRVVAIRPVPFYLRFVATSEFGDGSLRYQLNLQSAQRTFFARMDEVILGYKVAKYQEKGRGGLETLTMVRQADKYSVELVKGRLVTEQELAIRFVSLIDRAPLPTQRLNDVFAHKGKEYKVVDIRKENVLIQDVKTGKSITVPLIRNEERSLLTSPQGATTAKPGAASGSPW